PPPLCFTLSLHDALPILRNCRFLAMIIQHPMELAYVITSMWWIWLRHTSSHWNALSTGKTVPITKLSIWELEKEVQFWKSSILLDRKSTRLNSSHVKISY